MKKLMFALMCVVAMTLASCGGNDPVNKRLEDCDNTVYRCWELTYTYMGASASSYTWCTEWQIVYVLQESQKNVPVGKYSYKEAPANTEEACEKLQESVID